MRVYAHDTTGVTKLIEKAAVHTADARSRGMPHWIFAEGDELIGVLIIGQEPVRMLDKPGTPTALLCLADLDLMFFHFVIISRCKNNLALIPKKCDA